MAPKVLCSSGWSSRDLCELHNTAAPVQLSIAHKPVPMASSQKPQDWMHGWERCPSEARCPLCPTEQSDPYLLRFMLCMLVTLFLTKTFSNYALANNNGLWFITNNMCVQYKRHLLILPFSSHSFISISLSLSLSLPPSIFLTPSQPSLSPPFSLDHLLSSPFFSSEELSLVLIQMFFNDVLK